MRNILITLVCVLVFAACSTPKYSYHFDHYDYNSGRKQAKVSEPVNQTAPAEEQSPLALQEEALVASNTSAPVVMEEKQTVVAKETKEAFLKKYNAMTKSERKEFRKEVKKELKNYVKAKKSGEYTSSQAANMDRDLKLAIIFGAVGLVLTLFGGASSAFWVLGVIAIVIGVVFLVKWLMRQ
jgi:hypothetical protein